jgi:iron complex transport system ATP-binding protein
MLETQGAQLSYQRFIVCEDLTIAIPEGRVTAIVGANGSGKSTVLRALARILAPTAGAVLLDGKELHRWRTNEVAKRLAILPQAPQTPDGLTVWDLVAFGRFPYRHWFGALQDHDAASIHQALTSVGMLDLAERPIRELSGGQRQRAWIALALAQETPYLLLDEPTTHLDLEHQMEVMDLVGRLNRELRKTVVLVLHDLNLAARYAQHMIVLAGGTVVREGTPAQVLTPEILRRAFHVDAHVFVEPHTGTTVCLPLRTAS